MNDGAGYTKYHPRWLRPKMSIYWWLKRRSYLTFILRELSCIFVAWFVIFFLLLLRAVGRGDPAYQRFLELSGAPLILAVNVVSLLFVIFHAITWFNLAPKAMALRIRGRRVPPFWIAAPNFVAWALVSAVVVWLMLGG